MSHGLNFIKWARDNCELESCLRRFRICDYEPGHVRYQFGHYPTQKPYYPTEEDWRLLDLYVENGVSVVHVWGWNGECGSFGRDVYEPLNKKGLRKFVNECHRRNLKVIPYVSPGYLDVNSSTYRPEWSRSAGHLVSLYIDLDMLCPGSPGWRTYFFGAIDRLMDDYGFDGVYWDGGMGLARPGCSNPKNDNHIHFAEISTKERGNVDHLADAVKSRINDDFAALWNDFVYEIYVRVKKRNGLVVAHIGSDLPSPFKDKCWDYQLLGEGIGDVLSSIEKTKTYEPYVLRFNDWSKLITDWKNRDLTPKLELVPDIEHLSMAASIPYLQFPWLEDGCWGEDEDIFNIPGVKWYKDQGDWDHWTEWAKAQKKAGLPPFLAASFAAGRDRYFKYLRIYRQMTKGNTIAYIEIKTLKEKRFPVSNGNRRVSVFVNDSLWVAIGNLNNKSQEVSVQSLQRKDKKETVILKPKSLTVLRYYDTVSHPEIFQF